MKNNTTKTAEITRNEILETVIWHRTVEDRIDSDGDQVIVKSGEDHEPLKGPEAFLKRRVELTKELNSVHPRRETLLGHLNTEITKRDQVEEFLIEDFDDHVPASMLDTLRSQRDEYQGRLDMLETTWEDRNGQTVGRELSKFHLDCLEAEWHQLCNAEDFYVEAFREALNEGQHPDCAAECAMVAVINRH